MKKTKPLSEWGEFLFDREPEVDTNDITSSVHKLVLLMDKLPKLLLCFPDMWKNTSCRNQ
jgi:hypothetical protein